MPIHTPKKLCFTLALDYVRPVQQIKKEVNNEKPFDVTATSEDDSWNNFASKAAILASSCKMMAGLSPQLLSTRDAGVFLRMMNLMLNFAPTIIFVLEINLFFNEKTNFEEFDTNTLLDYCAKIRRVATSLQLQNQLYSRMLEKMGGNIFETIAEKMPSLVAIGCSYTSWPQRMLLDALLKFNNRLEEINLDNIDDESWLKIDDFRKIAENCTRLRILRIGLNSTVKPEGKEFEEAITHLAQRNPFLERLDFSFGVTVADKALLCIAKNCHRLKEFSSKCEAISDETLSELAINNSGLTVLDLGIYGDEQNSCAKGLKEIFTHCSLKKLNLRSRNVSVTEEAIECLAENCIRLVEITCGSLTKENFSKNGDACFANLARSCSDLEIFNMSSDSASVITDKTLIELGKSCPKLTDFVCNGNNSITNEGLIALANGVASGKLQEFDIADCGEISDEGFIAIFRNSSKSLSVLLVQGTRITDAAVFVLAKEAPPLTRADFQRTSVSDKSMIPLARACPTMNTITIRDTKVTSHFIYAVAHSAWAFSTLWISKQIYEEAGIECWKKFKELQPGASVWGHNW
jgi:hypothetical protein